MDGAQPHEIVIIKRVRHEGEAAHHGGVWKIAFADFMTAMMAFFLVMWLISANDKTRATIARYFNPVQLVDSTPQPRGLNDPNPRDPSVSAKTARPPSENEPKAASPTAGEAKTSSDAQTTRRDDAELFKDPYAVLAELAAKNSFQPVQQAAQASVEGPRGGTGAVGIRNGEAYRDPFEPLVLAPDTPPAPAPNQPKVDEAPAAAAPAPDATPAPRVSPKTLATPGDSKATAASATVPTPADQQAQTAALGSKIAAAVKQDGGAGSAAGAPKVEVRRTEEGLLISLTDDANFSMFASASAEPVPKMVGLMEKIGRLLKAEKGKITLRGFTDNRPFKSDTYDNWRLSSARADMAHYMLVRGGLDDARIDRIEGYADRHPKNPKDPGGAENRRIEILLRDTAP